MVSIFAKIDYISGNFVLSNIKLAISERIVWCYLFGKSLPKSTMPVLGKVSKFFRRFLCKHVFASCGVGLVVKQGACFGNGKDIKEGN